MICELIIYSVIFNIVINPFALTVIIYLYDTIYYYYYFNKEMITRQNRYFYQIGQTVYFIDESNDELQQEPLTKKSNAHNYFELMKGYNCSLEDLIKYRNDFNKWNDELKQNSIFVILVQYPQACSL